VDGACVVHVDTSNACEILDGLPEGNQPLRRTCCSWEDHIKTDLREVELESVDWIHLEQDRDKWWAHVNTVMKLRVH
jgi:hypothetical protein